MRKLLISLIENVPLQNIHFLKNQIVSVLNVELGGLIRESQSSAWKQSLFGDKPAIIAAQLTYLNR